MPVIIHGLDLSPPCRAVMLTGRAIGIDIVLKDVDMFVNQEHKSESFRKMNPAHTIPTMDDNGFYLWESRAIMSYLVNHYAKSDNLYPKEPKLRGVVDNMLYFDGTSLYPCFADYFYPQVFAHKPADPEKEAVVKERLEILNTILGQRRFVAGDHLTIADFSIISSLTTPKAAGYSFDCYTNIKKWIEHMKEEAPYLVEVTKPGIEKLTALFQQKTR